MKIKHPEPKMMVSKKVNSVSVGCEENELLKQLHSYGQQTSMLQSATDTTRSEMLLFEPIKSVLGAYDSGGLVLNGKSRKK